MPADCLIELGGGLIPPKSLRAPFYSGRHQRETALRLPVSIGSGFHYPNIPNADMPTVMNLMSLQRQKKNLYVHWFIFNTFYVKGRTGICDRNCRLSSLEDHVALSLFATISPIFLRYLRL